MTVKILCVATANCQLMALEWIDAPDREAAIKRFIAKLNTRQFPLIYEVFAGGEGGSQFTLDCHRDFGNQIVTLTSHG